MNIAVCDDEPNSLKNTSLTVEKVFSELIPEHDIKEFEDETELLATAEKYDIVFLDIELKDPEHNGIWVAKRLKERDPDCFIIFITNYEEYIDDVIEKYAFRYWSKPIDEYRLRRSVKAILERMKTVTLENYGSKKSFEIPMRDVIYVTPEGKHSKIVTTDGEYPVGGAFRDIKRKFTSQNFCCCHGSYLVNLNYVKKYTKSAVRLGYGEKEYEVHMSRRRYAEFKERMFIVGGERV